jgi:hypothetical protein
VKLRGDRELKGRLHVSDLICDHCRPAIDLPLHLGLRQPLQPGSRRRGRDNLRR